jgi:hypothetical protein
VKRERPSSFVRLLPWLLVTFSILILAPVALLEEKGPYGFWAGDVGIFVGFMAFPVIGALVAARHPRNAIGWLFLGVGILVGLLGLGSAYARYGLVLHPEKHLFGTTLAAWLESWLWLPLLGTIPTFLFLLFPTGRPPSRRWVPLAWFMGIHIALITVLSMLEERLVAEGYSIRNPIGIGGLTDIEQMEALLLPFFPAVFLCASSLVFRYRRASIEERQQLKWVAVACALLAVEIGVSEVVRVPDLVFAICLGAIPVSVGIAMLRYRLYDIDVIINRTLIYGVLTSILGLIYVSLVVVLQRVTDAVAPRSDLAVAASTLAVAALFRPLRGSVQTLIDSRFYRRKYDAARVLERFAARLRDEVDLDHVRGDLLSVVRETMQPERASLWLRTEAD